MASALHLLPPPPAVPPLPPVGQGPGCKAARAFARATPRPAATRAGVAAACSGPAAHGDAAAARLQQAEPSAAAGTAAATPLLDAVFERGGRTGDVPFHVPGHKRGSSTPPGLEQMLGSALRYDLTELEGLDVLSTPSGPILEAQQAAAATWGADASWFLVNGTTGGIHAAVLATCGPGKALILARNTHLSAFNAMVLAGCTPVYVQPCYDAELGVAHALTPAALQAAFERAAAAGLQVGAALVVSPTYFGVLSDIAGLAGVCHSHGVPLLVDEAHGAHLGLHPALPPSALQVGADLAVQSTHKQLSAATQAAMLHVRGSRVPRERVSRALQVLQSSSPSYLLMCSLDAARAQAADPRAHEASLEAAALARRRLAALPGVRLLTAAQAATCSSSSSGIVGSSSASSSSSSVSGNSSSSGGTGSTSSTSHTSSSSACIMLDPLRLTLDLRQLGLTGYQAAAALEQQHGIVPELATPACVVLALSIGSTVQHAKALAAAVEQLCQQQQQQQQQREQQGEQHDAASSSRIQRSLSSAPAMADPPPAAVMLTPREAFFAASEAVPAAEAVGRVSAELLCPYPPGVPAAYPGEVLTAAMVQQLQGVLCSGGTVTGCADSSLATLRVVVPGDS